MSFILHQKFFLIVLKQWPSLLYCQNPFHFYFSVSISLYSFWKASQSFLLLCMPSFNSSSPPKHPVINSLQILVGYSLLFLDLLSFSFQSRLLQFLQLTDRGAFKKQLCILFLKTGVNTLYYVMFCKQNLSSLLYCHSLGSSFIR